MTEIKDLVIIGSGPSALSSAIYTSREDIDTTIYEKGAIGGIVATIDNIDNYPGFPDGVEGYKLADSLEKQAKRFGTKIEFGDVTEISVKDGIKTIIVDEKPVLAKSVLIATGKSYSKIGAPGEQEYFGKGVHYCATCDGAFYHGKKLIVVGGGNSAVQETIYLTRFATHIDLLVRSTIKSSEILKHDLQKLVDAGKVTIHLNTSIDEIIGTDGKVTSVDATKNGEKISLIVNGVFVFVGMYPNTDFLKSSPIELDDLGFVKSDHEMSTNVPGIFVSGDVRQGSTAQIASASGDGVTAAKSIREYLQNLA